MSATSLSVKQKVVASMITVGKSEDDGEWISRPDHPLMNNVVLDIVFENMKIKELKESRLVSKKWNVSSIPFVRSCSSWIRICGNQSEENEEKTGTRNLDTRRVEEFVRVFDSNSVGIPFDKFNLGAFDTTDGIGKEFLNICGMTAKAISFRHSSPDRKELFLIEDISEVLKSSPKSEYLSLPAHLNSKSGGVVKLFAENSKPALTYLKKLIFAIHYPEERKKCCPTFIEELLEVAPNISHIDTHDSSHGIGGSDYSAEDVLAAIDKLGRESSIESLHFTSVTKGHIAMMQRMAKKENGLKIKRLYLWGDLSSEELNSAQVQLATTLKDSLEDLNLFSTVFKGFFQFPTMPRLKFLSIAVSDDFYTRGINLKKIFPKLETLSLACYGYGHLIFQEFLTESEPCLTVKSLKMSPLYLSLNSFDQILKVFPKLTKLELDIEDPDGIEILMRIWTHMIQLESLELLFRGPITGIESLDCVFTGIPFQALQEIEPVVNSQILGEASPQLRKEIISYMKNQHSQGPSIGNLTNLRSILLRVLTKGEGTDLTDLTAFLGLYLMPSLECVTLDGIKFTEAGLNILKVDNNVGLKPYPWMRM